jgi:phosphatidylglycerophosphate synthase
MIPNMITSLRYLLSVALLGLVTVDSKPARTLAFAIVCVTGLTDVLDGYVARRTVRSPPGALLDPLADEFAVVTGFLCLLAAGRAPLWLALLVFWSRSLFGLVRILSVAGGGAYAAPQATTRVKMGVLYGGEVVLFALYAFDSRLSFLRSDWIANATFAAIAGAVTIAVFDFVIWTHHGIIADLYRRGH